MRILFIGDSIIRGTTGVNWVKHLARKHPDWTIENEGVNGDTLIRIKERLEKKLQLSRSYDAVVIQGGANDILIPSLEEKGPLFRKAAQHLLNKGYRPLEELTDVETILHDMVSLVKQRTKATIILTTIGCMSEDPGFYLNDRRDEFNGVIRNVARYSGCVLADTAAIFSQYLSKRRTTSYFLNNFFNTVWLDALQCRVLNRADALSRNRGLHLTIDGLHLNSRGGVIWLHEIEKRLLCCNDPAWIRALRK
ncbi:MAG: SGNH/GDSL hydrolase family protein [Chitinophagaceae bacterium]|nr:SGNH/GDSL hydrolase family protein [Chitinophagaceae bacterium]